MYTFPYLVNGPINEQQLLQMSSRLIEVGIPEHATARLQKAFERLRERHVSLEVIVQAYRDGVRSSLRDAVLGFYYARLERAIGTYRSTLILTRNV